MTAFWKGKRVHFVVPRFHTNMIPWVRSLQAAGARVSMDTVTAGATEDHSLIKPVLLPQSRLSLWLEARKPRAGVNRPFAFPSVRYYWRHLRTIRPDVLVVRDPGRYLSRLAILLSRFTGARLLLYNQRPVDRYATSAERLVIRVVNALTGARWISPVSVGADIRPQDLLPGHHFVPFAADVRHRPMRASHDPIRMLSIGKFEKRKNQILLVRAVSELISREHRIRLTLIGEASTPDHRSNVREVEEWIATHGLGDVVTIRTNLPPAAMAAQYEASDLFVLPSSAEPASVSVIEAIGSGLPVVCSDQNGTRCYVRPGRNGAVFKSDDLESLVSELEGLLGRIATQPGRLYQDCEDQAALTVTDGSYLHAMRKALS
jgi:glycosyltransferase involved in cell wall biosynthesis